MDPRRGSFVVGVAGCGNIGSHVIPLLARIRGVGRLILCDKDVYSESNLVTQGIDVRDVGRPKVEGMAEHLRRIAPDLEVECFAAPLANVPLALLRADCWVGGLDSNSARRDLNAIAWNLGAVLIDGGVLADGGLFGKVDVYVPSAEGPCLECGWDDRIYESLDQVHPCGDGGARPTGAPAAIGALVGAIQALEVEKLVAAGREAVSAGRRIVIDAKGYRLASSRLPRNPRCRFDHEIWSIQPFPGDPSAFPLGGLVDLAPGAGREAELRVYGDAFVTGLLCRGCGASAPALGLSRAVAADERRCARCGDLFVSTAIDRREWLDLRSVGPADLSRPLASIGIRAGDVIAVRSPHGSARFAIGRNASDSCGGREVIDDMGVESRGSEEGSRKREGAP